MKYRVELDCSFSSESDAVSFLNLLRDIQSKLYAGRGDEVIPIISTCRYHECFHDETPPKQCGGYVNFDLKTPITEAIKTKGGVEVDSLYLVQDKVNDLITSAVETAKTEVVK